MYNIYKYVYTYVLCMYVHACVYDYNLIGLDDEQSIKTKQISKCNY